MEMIFPRKVTVRILDAEDNVLEETTEKTWLSRAQISERTRFSIEILRQEDPEYFNKIAKVELI